MAFEDEQPYPRYSAPKAQTGHAYGLLGNMEVLVDPNTNEVFASTSGLGIGRKLGMVSGGRFYAAGPAMGDAAVRNLDAQAINYDFPNPAPSSPTKPKFNPARAQKFSGAGGYVYAIDPETNVIAILKSPRRTSASPVYVRPDGKFPDAYKAIMAEYRASQVPPAPTKLETAPKAPTLPPTPTTPPSDAVPVKKRRGGFLSRVFNSLASDIESDDI